MLFAFPGSTLEANGCGLSTRYGQRGRFRMAMSVSAMGHPRGAVGVSGHSIVAHAATFPTPEPGAPGEDEQHISLRQREGRRGPHQPENLGPLLCRRSASSVPGCPWAPVVCGPRPPIPVSGRLPCCEAIRRVTSPCTRLSHAPSMDEGHGSSLAESSVGRLAAAMPSGAAQGLEDCDGENPAALASVVGSEEGKQS